jgi:acetyl esterase/lipase
VAIELLLPSPRQAHLAMNNNIIYISLFSSILCSSCAIKLSSLSDKADEQIKATYKVTKDVSYGADKEQAMDVYLSADAGKLKNKNYTIVFLHGGGYYISDKSREERYIQPYLKKGLNVVNINYRIKREFLLQQKI